MEKAVSYSKAESFRNRPIRIMIVQKLPGHFEVTLEDFWTLDLSTEDVITLTSTIVLFDVNSLFGPVISSGLIPNPSSKELLI